MSDRLATYLHDHLAGAHFAAKLLNSLQERHKNEELGQFALDLSAEVEQDQKTLQQIIERVGESHFDLAEAVGWIGEKASQLKLKSDGPRGGLGTFEALESLAVGIRGKLALWQALPKIREVDPRVPPEDYGRLAVRADEQFARVEAQRLQQIADAFRPEK